ncbi:MAG: ribonuclease HII [Prevotella sp.]|nr:ribonuclease HII [Prevotella sp.]
MLNSKYYNGLIEAGCDEAGRGCLAGSVFAAAVILPEGYENEMLNDSKQLTEKKRYQLREQIERDAIAWAVGIVTAQEIDKINILNSSILAMHRALDQLKVRPEAIIVDGNKFKPYKSPVSSKEGGDTEIVDCPIELYRSSSPRGAWPGEALPHTTIVKGDGKYLAIAAASILAKTYRDDYMNEIDKEYPVYQWKKNKGYPTKAHYAGIHQNGPSPYHRLTFAGVVERQLELNFDPQ